MAEPQLFNADLAMQCAIKRRVDPATGAMIEERRPIGYHELWISAEGYEMPIALSTAACFRREPNNLKYARGVIADLRAAGYIPSHVCPLRDEDSRIDVDSFPEELRSPCSREQYGKGKRCVHVTHVMATRSKRYHDDCERVQQQRKPMQEKLIELERQRLSAQQEQNAELMAALQAQTNALIESMSRGETSTTRRHTTR